MPLTPTERGRRRGARFLQAKWSFACVPLLLAPGCLLPSFERVDSESGGSAGVAGRGGDGGTAGSAAGAGALGGGAGASGGEGGESGGSAGGGAGGEAPSGEAGAGGAESPTELPTLTYYLDQGDSLSMNARVGVLADVRSDGWVRILGDAPRGNDDDPLRLTKYDATFAIESDGEFHFEPVAAFFGSYEIRYEAENDAGERAAGLLRMIVRPSGVSLATVADGVGGFAITGPRYDDFGSALAGVGDVDGDGYGDFAIGAPATDADAGAVYLVFGSDRGASLSVEAEPDEPEGYAVLRGAAGERLGTSIAAAGDRNGDGFADLLIGAPGDSGSDGRAVLVHGRSRSGFAVDDIDAAVAGAHGRVFLGAPSENAGEFVAGGGDFTRDGKPDLIVVGQQGRGRFYVVDGDEDGDLSLESDAFRLLLGAGTIDVALGAAVVGDVAGEGSAELLVATRLTAGLVYGPASGFPSSLDSGDVAASDGLLLPRSSTNGSVSLASAGDFDGDGLGDLVWCDELYSEPCRIVPGEPSALDQGTRVGGFSAVTVLVAGGADSSGDDFSDLLFAEKTRAYVVYGRTQPGNTLAVDALGARGFGIDGGHAFGAVALGGELDRELGAAGAHDDEWLLSDTDPANGASRVYVITGAPYSQ